jgi:uncharacterized cupin superfamily protein
MADSRPTVLSTRPNVFTDGDWDMEREPMGLRGRSVGQPAGTRELDATVYELEPGATGFHLHAHYGLEELFVVLEGTPTLRTHEGDHDLTQGDVVACPRGREGTHTFANRSGLPVRVLAISTRNFPDVVLYPELGKAFVMTRHPFEDLPKDVDQGLVKVFELDA